MLKKPIFIRGDSTSSKAFGLRWIKFGVDLIKKPNSVTLLQFGNIKNRKINFLAIIPQKPNPYPNFLLSWAWKKKFICKKRVVYGTTTRPVQITRSSNGLQVRRRTDRALSGQ